MFNYDLYSELEKVLKGYGLPLRASYSTTMQRVCSAIGDSVEGKNKRVAVCMPTGTGKTTTIQTLIHLLQKQKRHYPMLVAVPNVKSMAEFKTALASKGVDMPRIGFVYSETSGSVEDRGVIGAGCHEFHDKDVLVICHQRVVKNRLDWEKMLYVGTRQRAVFYDEALRYGTTSTATLPALNKVHKSLGPYMLPSLKTWLDECLNLLEKAPVETVVHLPTPPENAEKDLEQAAKTEHRTVRGRKEEVEDLAMLTTCSQLRKNSDGVLTFDYTLPDGIESLFVFDANHMHSAISKLDTSIEVLPIPSDLKRYDNVTIRYNSELSIGKEATLANVEKVKEFLHTTPEDRLVIAFKDMAPELEDEKKLVTWGNHAGINEFRDTSTIVLLGALRLSDVDTAARMTLTKADLHTSTVGASSRADEERGLVIYQAVSRGVSRKAKWAGSQLQAEKSDIYISGRLEKPLREFLKKVMPGVQIVKMGLESPLEVVLKLLSGLREKVGTKKLWELCGLQHLSRGEKDSLIEEVASRGGWRAEGRSLTPLMT